MEFIPTDKILYDLTGDMSKHFPKLKKRQWIINDVEFEITDQSNNDLREEKLNDLNTIKEALETMTVFDTLQNYSYILTGKNGPWICKKLNIKLNGEEYKSKKIKVFEIPDNTEIVHNQGYAISNNQYVYFINLDVLKLSQVLKLVNEFKKIEIKFVIMTKKYDLHDLFEYFDVLRSTHSEKGFTILI